MAIKELIAWDAHCKVYLPANEIGQSCPFMDNGGGNPHKLRKRRAFICSTCSLCFFDAPAFSKHLCEEGGY